MASNVVFNGVTYSIPAVADDGWGPDLSAYFISIASNALQKTGGSFTLTADADFGASYGLKSAYYTSKGTNPASNGAMRLANAEGIYWRNAANSGNLGLIVNASNALQFNGSDILSQPTVTGTRASPSAVVAGTGIAFTGSSYFNMWFIEGSGGAVTISANPQIAAGSVVGQRLKLVCRNNTNTVTFSDGTGLDLNGDCVMGSSSILELFWDGTNWVEEYRRT